MCGICLKMVCTFISYRNMATTKTWPDKITWHYFNYVCDRQIRFSLVYLLGCIGHNSPRSQNLSRSDSNGPCFYLDDVLSCQKYSAVHWTFYFLLFSGNSESTGFCWIFKCTPWLTLLLIVTLQKKKSRIFCYLHRNTVMWKSIFYSVFRT